MIEVVPRVDVIANVTIGVYAGHATLAAVAHQMGNLSTRLPKNGLEFHSFKGYGKLRAFDGPTIFYRTSKRERLPTPRLREVSASDLNKLPAGGIMATLSQIESRIQKLQSQADALRQKEAGKAIATIHKIMADYQLTVNDLDRVGKPGRKPAGKTVTTSPAAKKKAVPALTKSGKVDGRKGPRPAMYRDPKTGATWSGWARPPAWIANVKDRSVFLIDKADGPSPGIGETKPVAKKAVKGATAGKKSASKRATAKKIASKSSTAGSNAKIRTGAKAVATKTATGNRSAKKLAARKSLSAKGPATKKAARPQAGIEQVARETTEIQSAE